MKDLKTIILEADASMLKLVDEIERNIDNGDYKKFKVNIEKLVDKYGTLYDEGKSNERFVLKVPQMRLLYGPYDNPSDCYVRTIIHSDNGVYLALNGRGSSSDQVNGCYIEELDKSFNKKIKNYYTFTVTKQVLKEMLNSIRKI